MHTEKQIEQYLGKRMESIGALNFKFVSPGKSGVPDRLFIMPDGTVVFVEVKCKTGRIAPLQKHWVDKINKQGATAAFVWSYEDVDNLIKGMLF